MIKPGTILKHLFFKNTTFVVIEVLQDGFITQNKGFISKLDLYQYEVINEVGFE
ncbi:hypothetical protein [Macrococcoides bohemicum]|uniref:hypothetical protein n=1 Tax=Macrococcoides bohemicum TaxID=1903056 RepID=UPI0014054DEE|nr:hypothetical protein [Macrococcus bohemicus]